MRKLMNFIPPKPITEPFGPGTGTAHTFHIGRDGCESILETKNGNVEILQRSASGQVRGFIMLSGGGYGRIDDAELEQAAPKKAVTP